jgi:uncharacterized protein (TIRG00374 family)
MLNGAVLLRAIKTWLPWVITGAALWFTFRGIDWDTLVQHLADATVGWLFVALALSILSYSLRARRWQTLFPKPVLKFRDSIEILLLGFFMNNILPARAGEFVRAHFGGRRTGEKRTVVLATIFSERLADGLAISLFFIVFASSVGDAGLSRNFIYVAWLFGIVGVAALAVIWSRAFVFSLGERIADRIARSPVTFTFKKLKQFIEGLAPLFSLVRIPSLVLYSTLIWSIELCVYWAISEAFNAPLDIAGVVLFMVAVNFSSLVPAAPGGIGVIEMVGSFALASIGIDREHALSMVITQHAMQYVLVGVPGAYVLLTSREKIPTSPEANLANGEADVTP